MYKRRSKASTVVPLSVSVTSSSSNSSISITKSSDGKENKKRPNVDSDNETDINEPSSPMMFDDILEQPVKKLKAKEVNDGVSKLLTSQKSSKVVSTQNKKKLKNVVSQHNKVVRLTYLEEVTQFAGMILHKSDSPNELNQDQALFTQNVQSFLSKDEKQVTRNVEIFMEDLKTYCNEPYHLKNALSPTKTIEGSDITRGAVQDSFFRLLLQVDLLHIPLTQFLIDKMAEYTADQSQEGSGVSWVRMIVQALKFLNMPSQNCAFGEQLFGVINAASDIGVQQEIISSLPEIIQDDEHHECAIELSKFMRNKSLLPSILDALSNLSLQTEIQSEVQEMLINALRKSPPDYLPNMVKFLLSCCSSANVDKVIAGLRTELIFKESESETETNRQTSSLSNVQVLVFNKIQDCLLIVRFLYNAWLKNITTTRAHRPIDIIVLLILYKTASDETRRKSIVALFRSKIKDGLFKEKLLKETFETFIVVIKEYFKPLLEIASALLKSPDVNVIKFAGCIYSDLFEHVKGYWCKWIIDELLVFIGAGRLASATSAYKVLQDMSLHHQKKMKPFSTLLVVLLNRLNELALTEARQVMDMLCHIAYSTDDNNTDCSALQDELNMLVQKQFASLQLSVVQCGVVGAAMLLKHVAAVPQDESNSRIDRSIEEADLSPYAKKALPLLELILHRSSHRTGAEVLGLTLDQLSYMIMGSKNIDQTLIHRLSSIMRSKIQDMYLVPTNEFTSESELLPLKLLFCLDDDLKENVAINIGTLIINELQLNRKPESTSTSKWPLACLQPLIRLLRALEKEDLTEIDALLGCPVVLPALETYTVSEFTSLTPYQQHVALHCLFLCINWFREIISCFAFLVRQKESEKVLIRLRTIIRLQDALSQCLPLAMEYTPPQCFFHKTINKPAEKKTSDKGQKKKKKQPAKKKKGEDKKRASGDNTILTEHQEEEEDEDDESVIEEKRADLSTYSQFFRELDIDVWLLLTLPLVLNPSPEKDGVFSAEMGPSELLFLLDDFVRKLTHSLPDSVKRVPGFKTISTHNIEFETLDTVAPHLIAKNTVKLLPSLCSHFEKTIEYSQNLLRTNDEIYDAPGMFLAGSSEIKQCQRKVLSIFGILFSWTGFHSDGQNDLLIAGLHKLADRMTSSRSKTSAKKTLVQDIFKYLSVCGNKVLDVNTAVALVVLMKTLCGHASNDISLQKTVSTLCHKFLSRPWFDLMGTKEQGMAFNKHLLMLLENHIGCAENKREVVTEITTWMANEIGDLADKDSSFKTFPVFTKGNLNVLLKGILNCIEKSIKMELAERPNDRKQLDIWMAAVLQLEHIVSVVKAHDSKANLAVFLKGSTAVLRLFLNNGMTICNYMFKTESNDVSLVLKKLQVTTRYLHSVINFVKVSKDAALQQHLPIARSVMESIVLQVKNTIVLNNCTDAFFLGSMKNRDLKGQEIITQTSQGNQSSQGDDEREEEDGDEDDDDNDNDETKDEDGEAADDQGDARDGEDEEDDTNSISDLC